MRLAIVFQYLLGERSHLLHPEIDLDLQITDVVNVLQYEDLRDVILAGHSYGGMVITGVADRAGDRVGHLVYLDAALPQDGESQVDVSPALILAAYEKARTVDGVELILFPNAGSAAHYGVTDPHDAAWMDGKLTPHPWACFSQPLRLKDEAAVRRIPRTIVNCTPTLKVRPADKLHRAFEAERVWEIDTGHDLMLSEPEKVAEMLLRLASL